jgi:hypothetical protein
MGIFEEMWDGRSFFSHRDYTELRRMLSEAIAGGYVERIQVMPHHHVWSYKEEWYRDKETGEIYSLTGPGERESGHWERVDLNDPIEPGEKSQ